MAVLAQAGGELGIGEKIANLVSTTLYGMDQVSSELMDDLGGNAAHGAGHHRFLLPKTFGYRKSEPFFQRLLHNYGGSPLQGVDFQGRPGWEIQYDDVGIVAGSVHDLLQ